MHYRDGDGGTLDCTVISGLKDYIEKMQWGDLLKPVAQDFFVEFRESNHDALELGHTYTMKDACSGEQTIKHFGYLALIQARRNLANSEGSVFLSPPLRSTQTWLILSHSISHTQHLQSDLKKKTTKYVPTRNISTIRGWWWVVVRKVR